MPIHWTLQRGHSAHTAHEASASWVLVGLGPIPCTLSSPTCLLGKAWSPVAPLRERGLQPSPTSLHPHGMSGHPMRMRGCSYVPAPIFLPFWSHLVYPCLNKGMPLPTESGLFLPPCRGDPQACRVAEQTGEQEMLVLGRG